MQSLLLLEVLISVRLYLKFMLLNDVVSLRLLLALEAQARIVISTQVLAIVCKHNLSFAFPFTSDSPIQVSLGIQM